MDRFLCALLIGAMLLFGAAAVKAPEDEAAQPVFFSLLFPQLMPSYEEEAKEEKESREPLFMDEDWWKAVFL